MQELPALRFRLLGSPDLRGPDGRVIRSVLSQPKRLGLLAYLALSTDAEPEPRGRLVALFWPDSDEERGRNSLSQALTHLRRSLGEDVLVTTTEVVGLDKRRVETDVSAFEEARAAGRYEDALALYRRELLDGLHVTGSPAFGHWLEKERLRLQQLAGGAALAVTQARLAAGDLSGALESARQGLRISPWDERLVRLLVNALSRQGDRVGALAFHQEFCRRLADELGVAPSQETRDLLQVLEEGGPAVTEIAPPASSESPGEGFPPPAVAAGADAAGQAEPMAVREQTPMPRLDRLPRLAAAVLAVVALMAGTAAVTTSRLEQSEPGSPQLSEQPPPATVAVLPFLDLGPGEDASYLGDGIAEDVITKLARIGGLRVVPRSDAFRYRNSEKPVAEIAAELGASRILQGSVRREGERVRVAVQLVDPARGSHQWVQAYDRDVGEILAVQQEIANRVAEAVGWNLEGTSSSSEVLKDPRAYDYVLRARALRRIRPRSPALGDSTVDLARRAWALDSARAEPLTIMALEFATRFRDGRGEEWWDSSMALSKKAVGLDPEWAEAYFVLALQSHARDRVVDAIRYGARGAELEPTWGALSNLGVFHYQASGRLDESLRAFSLGQRVLDAQGRGPDPRGLHLRGKVLLLLGDLAGAEATARRSLDLVPLGATAGYSHRLIAHVLALQGRPAEALQILGEGLGTASGADLALLSGDVEGARSLYEASLSGDLAEFRPGAPPEAAIPAYRQGYSAADKRPFGLEDGWLAATGLALIRWRAGDRAGAEELLEGAAEVDRRMISLGNDTWFPRYRLATVHAIRGEHEEALGFLEEAVETGFRSYRAAEIDPRLQSIRSEPRFKALMESIEGDVRRMRQAAHKLIG